MLKHAYLIIAHTNPGQLRKLIGLLDDVRNDIYVLIDKKSKQEFKFTGLCKKSKLEILPKQAILWGGVSQIEAELSLFSAAKRNRTYQYYHLLSGMDLPLHNQDYIHAFFDKFDGYEFFTFVGEEIYANVKPTNRMRYYYPFQNMETNRYIRWAFMRIQDKILIPLQKAFHVNRLNNSDDNIGYGSNWVSVTEDFVNLLLDKQDEILKRYQSSWCCDEVYKHTILINSEFARKLFCRDGVNDRPEDKQGNLRYINWWDGSPKTWTAEDCEELQNIISRGYLWSRKCDERIDSEVIEWLFDKVRNEAYTSLYGDFIE